MTYKNSAVLALVLAGTAVLAGQDRLKTMAGYDAAQRIAREAPAAITGGVTGVTWIDDGGTFEYDGGKRYRYDVAHQRASRIDATAADGRSSRTRLAASVRPRAPVRVHDVTQRRAKGLLSRSQHLDQRRRRPRARAITSDGSVSGRVKYGSASWVYGEELRQTTAMWWSPDSRKIAYYRFDEREGGLLRHAQPDARPGRRSTPRRFRTPGRPIRPSICSSTTSRPAVETGRRARRQAVRQRASATTSIACRGRPTAASCSSSAPTGGRTSWSWPLPIPRPARAAWCSTRNGRPAGSWPSRGCCSSPTAGASSGSRSATAGTISISTISAAG